MYLSLPLTHTTIHNLVRLSYFFGLPSNEDELDIEAILSNAVSMIGALSQDNRERQTKWKEAIRFTNRQIEERFQLVRIHSTFFFNTPRLMQYAIHTYKTDRTSAVEMAKALTNDRISERALKKILAEDWAITFAEGEGEKNNFVEFLIPVSDFRYPDEGDDS